MQSTASAVNQSLPPATQAAQNSQHQSNQQPTEDFYDNYRNPGNQQYFYENQPRYNRSQSETRFLGTDQRGQHLQHGQGQATAHAQGQQQSQGFVCLQSFVKRFWGALCKFLCFLSSRGWRSSTNSPSGYYGDMMEDMEDSYDSRGSRSQAQHRHSESEFIEM